MKFVALFVCALVCCSMAISVKDVRQMYEHVSQRPAQSREQRSEGKADPKPNFPQQFTADFNMHFEHHNGSFRGRLFIDVPAQKASRSDFHDDFQSVGFEPIVEIVDFAKETKTVIKGNGREKAPKCTVSTYKPEDDPFANAKYEGVFFAGPTLCNVWSNVKSQEGHNLFYGADYFTGAPVYFYSPAAAKQPEYNIFYFMVNLGPVKDGSIFKVDATALKCSSHENGNDLPVIGTARPIPF